MTTSILHIIHNLDRAGAQINLLNLLTEQNAPDLNHAVFAWKYDGDLAEAFRAAGVKVYSGGGGMLTVWRRLREAFQAETPDIVHAHMTDSAFWACLLSSRRRKPFFVTFQDGVRLVPEMASWKKRIRMGVLKWAARRAWANICVTESLRDMAARDLSLPLYDGASFSGGLSKGATLYLPNAVSLPDLSDRTRAEPPEILSVGRYVDIKGQDQLIAAAPQILEAFPDAVFNLVGGGPLEEALKAQARALGVEKNIQITGPTNDPAAFLKRAAVYVSTSHYEGTSLALLEAMSWKLPIVVSDAPGNRDIITAERSGLHYKLHDAAQLADSIIRLLTDRNAAETLAGAALDDVSARFSARAIMARHGELYDGALRS